jgi:hypothetical protein
MRFNFYLFCHINLVLSKTPNLQRKNNTKPKLGGWEMLPHFPPKPHLE